FSRPRAKLIFAANPVVAMHKGKPTLMVRIGNGRATGLADARAQLNVLLNETAADGNVLHRVSGVAARAGAPSDLSTLLDADARIGRAEPITRLRCSTGNQGKCAGVRATRSARPDGRDNGARDPQLCGTRYPLRHALSGCCDYSSGRHPGLGSDQDRSAGARR